MNSAAYLVTYLKRILLLLLIYTSSRVYFYINNIDSFYNATFLEFLEGVRFDISALVYINIPLFILLLLPHNLRKNPYYKKATNLLFYGLNIPFILINNVDIEYFRFTQKRSTADFFQLLQLGSDAKNIIPQYMKDFWPITLFSILQIWLLIKIKNLPNYKLKLKLYALPKTLLILVFSIGLFIVSARGGLQLKPIKTINAGELCGSTNNGLILNTPFCILHSIENKPLLNYNYFSKEALSSIYNPIKIGDTGKVASKNIVILIMESYSKEFVGFYNKGNGHTPFLDSLMQEGLVFENAYANGLKSIEGLPAITAGIPTLMNNPFITSNYAQNKFESLASLLNDEGYNTSFFHGGSRGTMGFYSFSRRAGFQQYYGLEEYNNNVDFDGSWGIYDQPFMQYFAKHLKKKKQPFFTTLFSLSSHPPYILPKDYKTESTEIGILETIRYSDYAMEQFFKAIVNEDWFKNTIFIITADHTSGVRYNKDYKNKLGRYAIPMLIYKGDGSLKGVSTNIVQQIDIMPTVLEMLNYNQPYFAFGKSMFGKEQWAISMLQNQYRFISPNGIINNKAEDYTSYSDWGLNTVIAAKDSDILKLKAIKQSYNQGMINNKIYYEN